MHLQKKKKKKNIGGGVYSRLGNTRYNKRILIGFKKKVFMKNTTGCSVLKFLRTLRLTELFLRNKKHSLFLLQNRRKAMLLLRMLF